MEIEDFLKIVDTKLSDETLRHYVFGGKLTLRGTTRDKLILACNNVLRLAFSVVYRRFIDLKAIYSAGADAQSRTDFENSRITEALFATFTSDDASLEMVVYVLTEIFVNKAREQRDYGFLLRDTDPLTREPYDPALFDDLLKTIRNFEKFSGNAPESFEYMQEKFLTLISVMRFLTRPQLKVEGDRLITLSFFDGDLGDLDYSLWFEINGVTVPLFRYCEESDDYYYLLSVQDVSDKAYLSFVRLRNHNEILCEEKKYHEKPTGFKHRDISFLRRLFTESYKNLKESAFIFIDAIGRDDNILKRIMRAFNSEGKSEDFFVICKREGKSDSTFDMYNWDNLITMLVAQYGPSDFLDTVLDTGVDVDHSLFQNILAKIEQRYEAKRTKAERATQAREELDKQNDRIPKHLPREEREIYEKENTIFVYRRIIISTLRNLLGGEKERKGVRGKGFRFSAQVKHKAVLGIISEIICGGSRSVSDLLDSVKNDVKETLKLLIVFYEGLVAYGEKVCEKDKPALPQPTAKEESIKSPQRIAADLRAKAIIDEAELVETFCAKAKDALSGLKNMSLCQLNETFKALCGRFSFVPKGEVKLSETSSVRTNESRFLYKVINRHQILSIEQYELVTSIPRDEVSAKFPPNIQNIFEFFDKSGQYDYTKEDILSVVTRIKNFYVYLVFASDYKNDGVIPDEKDVDPIFPYHIKYQSKVIDKDKYNKNTFLIRTSMGDITGGGVSSGARGYQYDEIKILTDKDYDEHEHFYAIPRREGSTPSWWITPFMIPSSSVNMLMSESEEESNAAPNA